MMLDSIASERLRTPSPWELAQWRAAAKRDRRGWEDAFDGARFCYAEEDALRALETEQRRADRKLWCGISPASAALAAVPSELIRHEFFLARNLFSWPRFSYRTEAGGKITAVHDSVAAGVGARDVLDGHAFANASAPNQPAAASADAAIGGRLSSVFAGGAWLESNIGPSNWRFCQDGTGVSRLYVFVPLDVTVTSLLSSTLMSATSGYQDLVSSGAKYACTTYNASGALSGTALSSTTSMVIGVGYYGEYWFRDATGSPELTLRLNGILEASSDTSGTPLAGDPSNTFCLGSRGDRAVPFRGRMAEIMIHKGGFTSGQRASAHRYIKLRYGLS